MHSIHTQCPLAAMDSFSEFAAMDEYSFGKESLSLPHTTLH
jgi:hypothetical protein